MAALYQFVSKGRCWPSSHSSFVS